MNGQIQSNHRLFVQFKNKFVVDNFAQPKIEKDPVQEQL